MIQIIDIEKRKEEIIELWQESFGDSPEYINFFLKNCPSVCIGTISDEHLVSMLFLLDGKINNYNVKYIYAACTDKEYRGRGLMKNQIGFAAEYCNENNSDGLFLVPAEESLYRYYAEMGFLSLFKRTDAVITPSNDSIKWVEINETDALNIRKDLLSGTDCFMFSDEIQKYSFSEHIFCGGKILFYNDNGNHTLIFICKNDNKTFIKEYLSKNPVKMLKKLPLSANNNKENIYIRFPIVYNNADIGEEGTKCGMCLPLNEKFREYIFHRNCFYAGMYLD